jgi:hypothetical protein
MFAAARSRASEVETPFWIAVTRLEHREWLVEQGRHSEAERTTRAAEPGTVAV